MYTPKCSCGGAPKRVWERFRESPTVVVFLTYCQGCQRTLAEEFATVYTRTPSALSARIEASP